MTEDAAINAGTPRRCEEEGGARQDHRRQDRSRRACSSSTPARARARSTAAFGMVLRAHRPRLQGRRRPVRQGRVGHRRARWCSTKFPELVTIKAMGEGFTWETQDRERDIAAARAAWDEAKRMIADPGYSMVLLDELNIVLRYDYLPLDEVLAVLKAKPARQARHRHRPQRQGRADRDRRPRHRDGTGQAPVPRRREGAGRDRVLTQPAAPPANLDEVLRWRRDVRHFQTSPLPEAEIERLFASAQLAPSVGNAQPWRFLRLRTPSLRTTLADHVDAAARQAGARYGAGEHGALYASLKLHGLREAPEIVAVFSDESPEAGHGLGIATMPEALRYSTVLAIHTMWLTAQSRGIGIGWVSILDPQSVTDMLDVPQEWRLIALLCLGYPADHADIPELEQCGWQDRHGPDGKIFER